MKDNAWITAIWDDKVALKAIVLAQSLRRVITNGKIVAIISSAALSDCVRDVIEDYFDVLPELDFNYVDKHGFSFLDKAKIFACKLYGWSKCVFLDPGTIVLRNCDEIFENKTGLLFSVSDLSNESEKCDLPLFVFEPSYQLYKELIELLHTTKFEKVSDIVNLRFQNWSTLPPNYFITTKPTDECNELGHPQIASLSQTAPWKAIQLNSNKLSNCQKIDPVSREWLVLFFGSVLKNLSPEQSLALKIDLQETLVLEKQFPPLISKPITSKEVHNYLQKSIAIIGYSCRFPTANNAHELWELLKTGGDGISQIPLERLTQSQLEEPRMSTVKAGFLKCPIDEFDAKFFGTSPREAVFMDPQQRLLVEVAWEALENSGINPHSLKGSNTGVFTGVWTHEYETLLTDGTTGAEFNHVVLGNAYSATSARVSYVLGLNGPNIVTESGCSSSMVSLHLACQSLRRNETPLVLVGGVNLLCRQFDYSRVSILAKDSHCKTFDEKADGFARGEGVGILILKKYSDAVKDGDRVMAIVRGTGISNEGTTNSFGTPSKYCQQIAIKEALKDAQVDPLLVDYVEAHGTGTPIGDPIEFSAIAEEYSGKRDKPLIVGSIKTNIGHSESAAGLAGILKVIMAMENEVIPQHRNLDTLNPSINLDSVPAIIPTEPMPWPKRFNTVRLAGVSSFGISGTNVHVILQEPPNVTGNDMEISSAGILECRHEILTLSAKSEFALKELIEKYISYFDKQPDTDLKDVVFSANNGRAHFKHRLAVVGQNVEEMKSNLEKETYISGCVNINFKPKVAFLFTGQGSQYFGMARNLYETSNVFKSTIDACSEVLINKYGISLSDILWNDDSISASIDETLNSQIAIFCVEYGLLKLWENFGIKPNFVIGHSVGEFAAATAAGVLSFKEALILVSERSRLIQNLPPGGLLVVRACVKIVQNSIDEFLKEKQNCWLDIAVINSVNEVVVAGNTFTLSGFSDFLINNRSTKSQLLAASHAFHSRDMDLIMEDFGKVAKAINYKAPKCNYISGSTGKQIQKADFDFTYWQKHARQCVNFAESVKSLENYGCNIFIEISAHTILLALAMSNMSLHENEIKLWLPSLRKSENEWTTLLSSLSKLYVHGFDVDWKKINPAFRRRKLELPTYPFQRRKFWPSERNSEKEIELGGKVVHPLIGKKIPNAGNDHIYQNYLNLKNLPYLKDHQVANIVILPGAGFLEMILAAGIDVFQTLGKESQGELYISEFLIDAALELEEDNNSTVQTFSSADKEQDVIVVKIFLYCNMNGYNDEKGWKCYASAKVSLTPFNKETPYVEKLTVNEQNINLQADLDLTTVKSRCESETSTEEYYKRIPEVGISFGKTFQSVSKVWKGANEALTLIPIPENSGKIPDYIYHPIVLDAMIQSFVLTMVDNFNKGLYLPVGIYNFQMLQQNSTSFMYAYVTWDKDSKNGQVTLYDEYGKCLALMDGLALVKTSLTSFLNAVNSSKNKLPGMYTTICRSRHGPCQNRMRMTNLKNGVGLSRQINQTDLESYKSVRKMEFRIVSIEILKTFKQLGWKPEIGIVFSGKQFITDLIISPIHEQFVNRMLQILGEEDILDSYTKEDLAYNNEYIVKRPLPDTEEIERELDELYCALRRHHEELEEAIHMNTILQYCVKHLCATLLGNKTGISTLFGGDIDPFVIYSSREQKIMNMHLAEYICKIYEELKQESSDSLVRIVEVGAGTGVSAYHVASLLQKRGIPFRYTFTDISQHFLDEAKIKFRDYSGFEYKILNVEDDPKLQGFSPYHYDVVIATNVIHATSYIRESVQNVRHLMAPGGILCLIEMFKPIRYADLIFGVLEGYWCFKDFDLRPSHPVINQQKWEAVLTECHFEEFECPYPDADITLLLSKATNFIYTSPTMQIKEKRNYFAIFDDGSSTSKFLENSIISVGGSIVKIYQPDQNKIFSTENNEYVFCVDPKKEEYMSKIFQHIFTEFKIHSVFYLWSLLETKEQERISLGLLHVFKTIISFDLAPKCFVVTRGIKYIGDQRIVNASNATVEGMVFTYINEAYKAISLLIDLDPDTLDAEGESQEIFHELWAESAERCLAFRNKKKYVFRATRIEKNPPPLRIPPQQRYCLEIPTTKNLNDVSYKLVPKTILGPKEVEIAVKATALNFRDIFVILKPNEFRTLYDAVGTDFSGIVTDVGSYVKKFKVGDTIFGVSNVTSVASHVVVPEDLIMMKPKEYTFADASTLPSVFLTSYYCLFNVAGLKQNETILIHVASGGVGLVAIQLAKKIGANIIATAGSCRKRAYLRSIGIKHVFHSRDISYGDKIEKVTGGRGVDMVLNSLTGVNFKETSLRICAKNARFVEMGKVKIWQPEDVAHLRPDVRYTIVDLEKMGQIEMKDLMLQMDKLFNNSIIEPLPYTRFDVSQIKEALNYFLKAQHIGKIVITIPEYCNINGKGIINDMLFNSASTYLITGGLGGIGLEVAKWMANSGARNLVLIGRNLPDDTAIKVIRNLNFKGCRVFSFQVDVGNWNQCKTLLDNITDDELNLPPLRGVIHSAGILSDGFIKDQSWEKFQLTYNAKVNGGWNLHELTKHMRMEHFVLFSSIAGKLGAVAQINHASANTFLNSLACLRHSLGLPAQTIEWGAWSDIGAATNSVYGKEGAFGFKPFTPVQGIASLKYIMSHPFNTEIMVGQIDGLRIIDFLPSLTKDLEEIRVENEIISAAQTGEETELFWSEVSVLDLEERTIYLKKIVEALIRKTLRLPNSEQVDEHQTFSEMGVDSLMAMEMRNKMQHLFGKYLTIKPTSLLDYPNLTGLSEYLARLTIAVDYRSIESNKINGEILSISADDFVQLLKNDSLLPGHITNFSEYVVAPSKIKNILITGATGHVGIHFLGELAQKPNLKLFCLVRGKTIDNGRKRLSAALKKFDLVSRVDLNKIEIILGNVTERNIGITTERYEKLCFEVDAIVHCAAKVNHIEHYQKHKTFSDIRSVNTLGLIYVLEFASTVKTKRLVYPSSVTSANEFTEEGYLSETLPTLENTGEGINIGYGHSKLVCEKLIRQAIDRGIPCLAFRYATLSGNSQSGLFTLDTNLYMSLIITFGQLEMIPMVENRWYSIPIDIAMQLSCSLIFNDDVESGLYNIIPKETLNFDECDEVASIAGTSPKLVSVAELEKQIKSANSVSLSLVTSYFSEEQNLSEYLLNSFPAFKLGLEQGKDVYCKSSKIEKYIPNFQQLIPNPKIMSKKMVEYAKTSGMLASLGIGTKN